MVKWEYMRKGNRQMAQIEKQIITIKELCSYLGIGQTKARELVRGRYGFGVQIGNRWYANKKKLDDWIEKNSI
mgnify:FL=1